MNKELRKQIREKYKNDYKISAKEVMEVDLNKLAKELLEKYFIYPDWKEAFEDFTCEWSKRMTATAGRCFQKGLIRLSVDYHRKNPDQIENTLAHELIHMKVRGHKQKFKNEMILINENAGKELITINSDERSKVKYAGYCPECEEVVATKSRKTKLMDGRGYYHKKCETTLEWVEVF